MENLKITNIIATFNINQTFSKDQFRWIAANGLNTELHPKRPHLIIIRLRRIDKKNYTISATLRRNGKVLLSGAKTNREIFHIARRITRYIYAAIIKGDDSPVNSCDYEQYQVKNLQIRNIAATISMPFRIHIENLHKEINENKYDMIFNSSLYEPTQFPALRTRFVLPNQRYLSVHIFISGKIIISGARNNKEIILSSQFLQELLAHYDRRKIMTL